MADGILGPSPARRLVAEALGTALLLAAIVGSAIMADRLAGGNSALVLLANAAAVGAALYVLITVFGPVSGAHFNPAVTMVFAARREIEATMAGLYIAAQIGGGVCGTLLAHAMFDEALIQASGVARTGPSQWLSEVIATFGLVFVILAGIRNRAAAIPQLVGLYIFSAFWFTASTSFANPAVTIARSLTNTPSGIDPTHAPAFIIAQILGAILAAIAAFWLYDAPNRR